MLFSFLSSKLGGVALIGIVAAGAVGYHYWTISSLQSDLNKTIAINSTLRSDLITSKNNQETLRGALNDQEQAIGVLQTQRKIDQEKINELTKQFDESRDRVRNLRSLLSRHDLGFLAGEKPGLIQNRVNKGTKGVGTKLKKITGEKND